MEIEDDETVEEAVPRLISRNRTYALLNAGAFGTAYDAVRELAAALRRYSEDESEIFYDQGLLRCCNEFDKNVKESPIKNLLLCVKHSERTRKENFVNGDIFRAQH